MQSVLFITFIYLNCFVAINNGANILALFGMPSKSHTIVGYDLCETLAKRGHHVTHVSAHPRGLKLVNYHEVNLTDFVDAFAVNTDSDGGMLKWVSQNIVSQTNNVFEKLTEQTDIVLSDRNLQKILQSNQNFDVIITGAFAQEAFLGIGHHFNAPIIITTPPGMNTFVDHLVGNSEPFSYVPNILFDYTDHMTFFQRVKNTMFGLYLQLYIHKIHLPAQNEVLHKHFPEAPNINDLMKNVAIILSNSHESIAYPRPLVPNVKTIGGIHVSKPKRLPKDLQNFLDDAPNGVIYFSFGSHVKSSQLPEHVRDSFVRAFSKLNQKILWKWDEPILGLSENVRLGKWFPQSDILAHPNVRLFLTHGGLLGTTESLVRGVPVVGIPLFADQFKIMKRANELGYGITLDFKTITEESILFAINEILNDKTYSENVKKRSDIINDQIVHPLDKAVFWVEYVIRHKGAQHLRSAGADTPLYQYLLLDVFGFILLCLAVICWILKCIISFFIRKLFGSTKVSKNKRKIKAH